MMLKIFFVFIMARSTFGQYVPTWNDYLLNLTAYLPVLSTVNVLDGPPSVTYASTTPTTNKVPTVDQITYYNYYAASMYCPFQLADLSCFYCQQFKNDISTYAVLTNDTDNTVALVSVSNPRQEIVVTYRGSMTVWNYVLDFTLLNVDSESNIKLHLGFYLQTMSLYNDVVEAVGYQRLLYPNYKIKIVGHSLGGAMAALTIYFFISLNQFPGATYEVYTFGQPRVGNKYFADYMNAQNITTVRTVNSADFAPHIMPVSVLGTDLLFDYYLHSQTEFWSRGTDNQRFCNDSTYEDPTCSDSLGPAYSVLDHFYYLNVDYLSCYVDQAVEFLALPFGIFEPVGVIPALPQPVYNFLGGIVDFVVNLVGPFL